MEPQSGIKTWQWVVTIIIIIVIIIVGVLVFGGKGTAPSSVETSSSPSSSTSANSLSVNDQYPGNVVYLNSVTVAQPSWVAIHTDNNGQPGKIIGTAHLNAGLNAGVKVTLSQPMVDGQAYYAMLHSDDGSGKFSETADQPLTDSNGSIIMRIFHASSSVSAGLKG